MINSIQFFLSTLVLAIFLICPATFANDGVASISVGGIELAKSDAIVMKKETLRISPKQVQVDYIFQNESKQDIRTWVMFPLPILDMGSDTFGEMGSLGSEPILRPEELFHFHVLINGKEYKPKTEIKAYLNTWVPGKEKESEITQKLTDVRIPLYPFTPDAEAAFQNLSVDRKNQLIQQGVFSERGTPQWAVGIRFYWEYRFPAGKPVYVSHRYQPASGYTYYTVGAKEILEKEFCAEASIFQKMNSQINQGTLKGTQFGLQTVDYILQTAKTWKGPILDFRLILEKKDPRDLIFLCSPGLVFHKTSDSVLEARKENYIPSQDLHILFIKNHHSSQ